MTRPVALFGRNWITKRTRRVEIATNPEGSRVYAGEVLQRYTPAKNQATPARSHISDHIFHLHILLTYGSMVGNICQSLLDSLRANQCCCTIASLIYVAANQYYAHVD